MGGQIRQQRKSHVRRRRAMRDNGGRVLLIVIRRQPIVLRADEGLEEGPGFSGKLLEKDGLVRLSVVLHAAQAAG